MECATLRISVHALKRFDEREFKADDIERVVREDEIIREYEDDRPWPSYLVCGRIGERVVHDVVARNSLDATCVAVTAYEPTAANWETELRTPKR